VDAIVIHLDEVGDGRRARPEPGRTAEKADLRPSRLNGEENPKGLE
jgi:hypothetical protein